LNLSYTNFLFLSYGPETVREITEGTPHQMYFFATVWMLTLEPTPYSHLSVAMNLVKHLLCLRARVCVCTSVDLLFRFQHFSHRQPTAERN